jgi:hypothetical protein
MRGLDSIRWFSAATPSRRLLVSAGVLCAAAGAARADEVTDWHEHTLTAFVNAGTSPLVASRDAALVSSAVFDAVNGVERRYEPIHVTADAPRGASKRAAVVEAAYTVLVARFPSQSADLGAKRTASLDAISSGSSGNSMERGLEWGQDVAEAILAWRSTDGFTPAPPAFNGGTDVGEWRPTPPSFASGAGPQFATMTPWGVEEPDQFRPSGPPALDSEQYAEDFNEVKDMGSAGSTLRSEDQTDAANFWNASSATYLWNRAALDLLEDADTDLSENAHLLATMNLAVADALICCWDSKYEYVFWRPITAIQEAGSDENDDTAADTEWTPLIATPAHPEYTSGHSSASSAAATVLADYFGDETSFALTSHTDSDWTRSFSSFGEALEEVADARVFAGIHFRTACDDGVEIGTSVAEYVLENLMGRIHGEDE